MLELYKNNPMKILTAPKLDCVAAVVARTRRRAKFNECFPRSVESYLWPRAVNGLFGGVLLWVSGNLSS